MLTIDNKNYICSLDYGIDLIKNKWKAILICFLNDKPQRFLELQRLAKGISQKVLTERLRELENDGLVDRTVYQEIPPKVEYFLTDKGLQLYKILNSLELWSKEYLKKFKKIDL